MNYYQILGISQSASNADIKRAYRKLAVVYHPDKNSDPRAEDVFKSINEAYEVLSDPDKRRDYDFKIQSRPAQPVQPGQPRHRDPAYRPDRPRVYKKSENQRLHELMEEYLPYVQKMSMLCLAVSLVMLIDYCWPYQQTKEKIEHVAERTVYGKSSSTTWWVINTTSGLDIDIHYAYAKFFPPGTLVEITASRFLKVPISVSVPKHTEKMKVSIYGNFIFAPIALLVLSALAVAFRKHVDYGFNLGIASFTFLLLLLFIIAVI